MANLADFFSAGSLGAGGIFYAPGSTRESGLVGYRDPLNAHVVRSCDPDAHPAAADFDDCNLDAGSNSNPFTRFSAENKHVNSSLKLLAVN